MTHIEVELISGRKILLPIHSTTFTYEKLLDGSRVVMATVHQDGTIKYFLNEEMSEIQYKLGQYMPDFSVRN